MNKVAVKKESCRYDKHLTIGYLSHELPCSFTLFMVVSTFLIKKLKSLMNSLKYTDVLKMVY